MKNIYMDNSSTSFPKPDTVTTAITEYMTGYGCNINRGCYESAYITEEYVYECRELLNSLFNGPDAKNVIFTKNITESINFILKGLLKENDHVIVSSMEHNAVMRPLTQLEGKGVTFTRIPCANDGTLLLNTLKDCVNANTKLLIMTHASNVCGTLMPIKEVGEFCHSNNIIFVVDSAQSAGIIPIDMKAMHIDALAFTGHKGLLGPQGIGGFILDDNLVDKMEPLISGGTGSISHTEAIPSFLPDRFEAGTMNLPGIMGLRASLLWLKEQDSNQLLSHELTLTQYFLKLISIYDPNEEFIRVLGRKDTKNRLGVVSLQIKNKDISYVAGKLDYEYHIMTRVGLHCAPNAHKTLNSYPTGSIRFSFGIWNTIEEIEYAFHSLKAIIEE